MELHGLLDWDRVAYVRAEFPEIADSLVTIFVETTPPMLSSLRDAASRGDTDGLRTAAHKLKGGCLNVGAERMALLALSIETGAADDETLDELVRAYEPTRAAVTFALVDAEEV